MNVNLTDTKGLNPKMISVSPSGLVGDKKKELGQENAIWKFDGQVLKNDKTFSYYDIEAGDSIITSIQHQGGINI